MTKQQWLEKAKQNATNLRSLLREYHPAMGPRSNRTLDEMVPMPITAPAAEAACKVFREEIREETKGDPLLDFDRALEEGNVGKLMLLLEQAWFGVPECTGCWHILGFKEACDLLDDPPDPDEADLAAMDKADTEEIADAEVFDA